MMRTEPRALVCYAVHTFVHGLDLEGLVRVCAIQHLDVFFQSKIGSRVNRHTCDRLSLHSLHTLQHMASLCNVKKYLANDKYVLAFVRHVLALFHRLVNYLY